MPYRGGRRYRANKNRLTSEEIDRQMEDYFTNREAPAVQYVQPVQPAPPVQKRPLPVSTAGASATSPKKPRLDATISFFGNALLPANTAPPATSTAPTNTLIPATTAVSSNVVAPSKLFSTSAQAPPKPPLPHDETTGTPKNTGRNAEVVSKEEETTQRSKTEEDVRAYCEVIDMFDQIVKKLWVRGRERKKATLKTENQWLLTSVEKDLMKKMASRLNQLADAL